MHPLNKKVKFMKDSIDFGSMEIPKLFRKLLIPTVLGMVFSAVFVITDGIFVGQGIGSDALAAVNITAPLFLISTGIGLMFGVGASVVASIHLSQGKLKTARINVTQAVVVSSLFLAVLWGVVCLFAPQVAVWLGSSERLLPLAVEYMYWFLPFLVFSALLSSGMFFVRLDGSPNYAMLCNAIPAVVNILLDYVFIFILKWGMRGAATATVISQLIGMVWVVSHFCKKDSTVHFEGKVWKMKGRIVESIFAIGMSPFLMNVCACAIVIVINNSLQEHGGDMAIGAYGIINRLLTLYVMIVLGLTMGMQPIVGYNFGAQKIDRVKQTLKLGIISGVVITSSGFLICEFFPHAVSAVFTDSDELIGLAVDGLRLTVLMFPFVGAQIVIGNFFQSIGKVKISIFLSLTRQLLYLLPCLLLFPHWWGLKGIWISLPVSDSLAFITAVISLMIYIKKVSKEHPIADKVAE